MAAVLTPDEVNRLLARGRPFRSRLTVRANRLTQDMIWTTKHGDCLHAHAGDWWVTDGDDGWTVAGEVFERTYVNVQADEFRKSATVIAVSVAEKFLVQTIEGPSTGEAGDWLVSNPDGECWPVPAEVFRRRYTEV